MTSHNQPPPIRILLADQQTLVRAGIRHLIESLRNVEVLAECGDGHQLLKLMAHDQPSLVITEIHLAGLSGVEFIERSKRDYPEVPILVLSDQVKALLIRDVLRAGASGFVAKDAEVQELEIAIRSAVKGQSYFSPNISRAAIEQRRVQRAGSRPAFTPRQREVMQLMAHGRSTKEIAALMGVGTKTVETHRARLMETLRLKTSNALIHYAIRHGFDGIN